MDWYNKGITICPGAQAGIAGARPQCYNEKKKKRKGIGMEQSEKKAAVATRLVTALMVGIGAVMLPVRIRQGSGYLAMLALGSCAFALAPWLLRKLLKGGSSARLELVTQLFLLFSFTGGMTLQAYQWLPGYDKFTHCLSGVVFALAGLVVYQLARPGEKPEKRDYVRAALFSFCFAMTTAGVWELYEYAISFVMTTDPQNVLTTGVGDTMQDMLACLIGAAALQPAIRRFYRTGEGGLLLGAVERFWSGQEKNHGQ